MRAYFLNPPAEGGLNLVREGRCMQRTSTWTAVWAPISLATTAAVLRDEGIEVALFDGSVETAGREEVKKFMAEWMPDLVVINSATSSIEYDVGTASLVKEVCPQAKTMVLGIHPSARPDDCFAMDENLDMAIRGEPEYTIRDGALVIRDGGNLEDVLGLSWRGEDGKVHHNKKRPFIEDLDELPYPAWDLIDTDFYRMPFSGNRFLLLGTARGCPYACTYCTNKVYYGAKVRMRSPKRMVDEMEWAGKEFGIYDFLFWSESFTNGQENAIETAREIIRRGLKVNWVCNSRVDTVSPELLKTIKEAGCFMIGYGIECGNQEVLDSVKKGTTLQDAVLAVRMAHDVGLEVTGHCVLGLPGETEETMRETLDFAKFLKIDYAQFYCAVAFPGSKLYEQCEENGWFDTNDWKYFEQNFSVITTPQLESKQVTKARERAMLKYYVQPRVILSNLNKIRSGQDVMYFARTLKNYLTHLR